jgi:hypothetical protein
VPPEAGTPPLPVLPPELLPPEAWPPVPVWDPPVPVWDPPVPVWDPPVPVWDPPLPPEPPPGELEQPDQATSVPANTKRVQIRAIGVVRMTQLYPNRGPRNVKRGATPVGVRPFRQTRSKDRD